MRAFVAIDMPDAVREALEDLQDELPVGRAMAPDTLHLTLAFLGEQPGAVLGEVHEALGKVRAPEFELTLQGLGTFGSRQPTVLWAGVAPKPELGVLRDRVRGAMRRAGVDLARERFRPHVTLARFQRGMRSGELAQLQGFLAQFAAFQAAPFAVDRFTLFKSVLHPGGAVHEALTEYPLLV